MPARLIGPDAARTAQVLRFLSTGGVATAVTVVTFNLLVHIGARPALGSRPVLGYLLAVAAGTVVSYVGNRWWAFRSHRSVGMARQLPAFLLINAIALGLPTLCLAVSRYALHADSALADNVSANVVGLVLATAFRYWGYAVWVFASPPPQRTTTVTSARR